MKKRVILDCDNTFGKPFHEIDDGLLLLYLLGRSDIDLMGITNTFGNGPLAYVSECTQWLLELMGREDIPRFDGEAYNRQNPEIALNSVGKPRYGDELKPLDEPTPAAVFLAEAAAQYPGEVHIIAAGPVGNLLGASQVNPRFFSQAAQIVCMGGYVEDLVIDARPCRELNLSCNPDAAYAMLTSSAELTVFTGQSCLDAPCFPEDIERIPWWPEEIIPYIGWWFDRNEQVYGTRRFFLWDLLPAVYLSYPELFDGTRTCISPTRESLHKGMLMPSGTTGRELVLPAGILDRSKFMEVIYSAWEVHAADWKKRKPELSWRGVL